MAPVSTPGKEQAQRLYTVAYGAEMLQVSEKTVYRMVADGRLLGIRLGDGASAPIRIVSSSLVDFLLDGRRRQLARRAP
jgi:excisionase family DNA binding protein